MIRTFLKQYWEKLKKSKCRPSASLWISLFAVSISGYSFYFQNILKTDEAQISVIGIDRAWAWDLDESMIAINALITNSGTNPFAIIQFNWVLSQYIDPARRDQRRIRWINRPDDPIVISGKSIYTQQVMMPGHADTLSGFFGFGPVSEKIFEDVPSDLKSQMNFRVYYFSSLVVHLVDMGGDIHEVVVPLGKIGFTGGFQEGAAGVMLGDGQNLPAQAALLPSRELNGVEEYRWIWQPWYYFNFDFMNSDGLADTTGWRCDSKYTQEIFDAWVANGGKIKVKN